jgi:hypothetical protein
MTRLSCHRFRANEVRLWLSVIDLRHYAPRLLPTRSLIEKALEKGAALSAGF